MPAGVACSAAGHTRPMWKRMLIARLLARRLGPWAWALTAWDVWRRIPPKQRAQIMEQARKHGPRVVSTAAKGARGARARSRAR